MESGTIEIRYSPKSMVRMIIIAAILTAGCGLMILIIHEGWTGGRSRYDINPGSFKEFVFYAAFFIFGLATVVLFWQFVTTKGPVVTLSRSGIRDIRFAKDEIPWSGIQSITTKIENRQQFLLLHIDPAVEARLNLTRSFRWTRLAGIVQDGFWLSAHGLEIDFSTLKQICEERVEHAHANSASRPWG